MSLMSEIEAKLKEANDNSKELFNFNGYEAQQKNIKELFSTYLRNSKNDINSFIRFIEHYSKCRPNLPNVSEELVECMFSCFPDQINIIQQNIRRDTLFLKLIIFPEEFLISENKEQDEMILLLQKDDIDGFFSFLSKNPTIDLTKEQELDEDGYYYYLFDDFVSLIDFCCFFGSLKCFKYLLLNKCEITKETLHYSIAGGNQEIIALLQQNGHSFEECLETSVKYHRYELTNWLLENYKCKPFPLSKCIEYYNIDAFFYFFEHGHSLNEITEFEGWTCLHSASHIGSLPIVQYLIEKDANLEEKDFEKRTPLHVASEFGHLAIVQYLIEKGANIEAKDCDLKTPLHYASKGGHTHVVKYLVSKGVKKYGITKYSCKTPYEMACDDVLADQSQRDIIRKLLK